MKVILKFILPLLPLLTYSQEEFVANNLVVQNEMTGKLIIENYLGQELYKNDKCKFLESSVEQKFCSFFNLNSKIDLEVFFKPYDIPSTYSKIDYLDRMKIYDDKSNFYTLDSKYIFDYGIGKDILIKYINKNSFFPKEVYSSFYLQEFLGKLIVKDMGENFDLGLFLISSNTRKTQTYFDKLNSKEININSFCNGFLENIKTNSNKNNLYDLIDKRYSPFFSDKSNNLKDETMPQKNSSYLFKKVFLDIISGVVLKKQKTTKEEISEKYNLPIEILIKDSLSVKEIINVNTMNNDFTIVKFYDSKPIIKTKYGIVSEHDLIYDKTLYVMSKINFEAFVYISYGENSKKFQELDKLKILIKGSDKVININKLADIISKNKIILSKYLDD